MSMYYRKEEPYGPHRFDDVPDVFGPYGDATVYEEGYSKKPVTSSKQAGESHHRECTYDGSHIDSCLCFELYNRDYDLDHERELEEMHEEWWQ